MQNGMLFSLLAMLPLAVYLSMRRSAQDVLFDLDDAETSETQTARLRRNLQSAGVFDPEQQRLLQRRKRVVPCLFVTGALALGILMGQRTPAALLPTAASGAAFGYLALQSAERRRKQAYKKDLEFYLPIVMERLVMGVQAGMDILAAITRVLELDQESRLLEGEQAEHADPVTMLLKRVIRLCESGISFEQALQDVAASVESSALRHAFIHLAQAHQEGGELVFPLRELSDSTQLYYQESIEEEIAKLPVKATLPLLLTFAGLIVLFITTPLVQVMEITSQSMP